MAGQGNMGGFVLAPPALGGVVGSTETGHTKSTERRDQVPIKSNGDHVAVHQSGYTTSFDPASLGPALSTYPTSSKEVKVHPHAVDHHVYPNPFKPDVKVPDPNPSSSHDHFSAPQPLHAVPRFNDYSSKTYTPPTTQHFTPPAPLHSIPKFSPPSTPPPLTPTLTYEDDNTMDVIYEPTVLGHISTATINNRSRPLILSTPPLYHEDLPEVGLGMGIMRDATKEEMDDLERLRVHEKEVEKMRREKEGRLVEGLENEDLNAMIRSFDKAVHKIKIIPPPFDFDVPTGLDLHPSPYEEFTVDKMRSVLERFYASIGVGMIRAGKEIQRVRNWEDGGRRTGVTLAIYVVAWWNDIIITTLLLFLSCLIFFPTFRSWSFQPPNTILHLPPNHDPLNPRGPLTMTIPPPIPPNPNAPSNTEDSAAAFADKVQGILKSLSTGSTGEVKNAADDMQGKVLDDINPDEGDGLKGLKKKELVEYQYLQPMMRIVGGLADKWERFANAIEPTPPFLISPRRTEVAAVLLAPVFLMTTFVSAQMISKGMGAVVGILMFAQPAMTWALHELDRYIPDWKEKLLLENNILSDVPTNAQLVLRLLRDAEHKQKPLPPPNSAPEGLITHGDESESESESSSDEEESDEDDENSQGGIKGVVGKAGSIEKKAAKGLRSKVRNAWDRAGRRKEEGFALITGHKEVDYKKEGKKALKKLRIKEDGKIGKTVLKKLPTAPHHGTGHHASRFYVHHASHGPGHLIIHPPTLPSATNGNFLPARLEFTTIRHVTPSTVLPLDPLNPEVEPERGHLVISINDLVFMEKWGMNWPGRILTSWALDSEGSGGTGLIIRIIRRDVGALKDRGHKKKEVMGVEPREEVLLGGKEEEIRFKGIVRRNELFDRLIAIGEQRWEML